MIDVLACGVRMKTIWIGVFCMIKIGIVVKASPIGDEGAVEN